MAATITPIFNGSYSGEMIYNNTNFAVSDTFKKYVESLEIVYDGINKVDNTGFSDVKYLENTTNATNTSGSISVMLVGDLPTWLMGQLTQLAKACIGGGMSLLFKDTWVSGNNYYCKWDNAGDFVENDELLCGGTMLLRFYYYSVPAP
jgi:hypothetical protein